MSQNIEGISVESKNYFYRDHQRDKMGEYFLWGYFNERPVYQHVSGLDFLYFHKNNVWGAGPKIGGNSAGLLNFGRNSCPYKLGKFSLKNIFNFLILNNKFINF